MITPVELEAVRTYQGRLHASMLMRPASGRPNGARGGLVLALRSSRIAGESLVSSDRLNGRPPWRFGLLRSTACDSPRIRASARPSECDFTMHLYVIGMRYNAGFDNGFTHRLYAYSTDGVREGLARSGFAERPWLVAAGRAGGRVSRRPDSLLPMR